MSSMRVRSHQAGFTFVELVVTLALIGLLATASLPLYEVTSTRMREAELREALRTIRAGLDAYKAAVDAGTLPKVAGDSGYPASLEMLTEPQEPAGKHEAGFGAAEPSRRVVILRRLPRDPFFPNAEVPAAQTWNTRGYGSRSDDPQPGADVFDVASSSTRVGLDGTPYSSW
jgi:general secretion pathway protein G